LPSACQSEFSEDFIANSGPENCRLRMLGFEIFVGAVLSIAYVVKVGFLLSEESPPSSGSAARERRRHRRQMKWDWIPIASPGTLSRIVSSSDTRQDSRIERNGEINFGCSICMSDYNPNDELRVLPCKHHFHRSCADEWFAQSVTSRVTCPNCRSIPVQPLNDHSAVGSSGPESGSESEFGGTRRNGLRPPSRVRFHTSHYRQRACNNVNIGDFLP